MKNIFSILLYIAATTTLMAQTGLLGYGSKAVVPTQMANPALSGNVRSHIAFPIISSIQLEQKSSFKISDWILKEEGKTYISPNKFAANALARNDMNTNLGIDLFSIGFSVKDKNYISLGAQHFTTMYASFSDDLIKFLAEGNAQNTNVNLNEESIYINQFNAMYLGYSRSLMNDKLQIGGRVKMLRGFGNFQTNNVNFNITTDANASPAYAVNVSGGMQAQAGGLFGILMDTVLNDNTGSNLSSNLMKLGTGMGFDLGMSYKITDKLTVSASAVNLGKINWNKDFTQKMDLAGTGKFEFSGIKTNLNNDSNNNAADSVEQKFKEAFKIQRSKESYSSSLPTMIYAAASYDLNAKNRVSAVFRTQSFNGKTNNELGVNYAFSPFKALQLLAGANMGNFKNLSFGAGMVANLGPMQLHLLADNISGLAAVDNANRLQIQAGLNVLLHKKVATPATPAPEPAVDMQKKAAAVTEPVKNVADCEETPQATGVADAAQVQKEKEAVATEPTNKQVDCEEAAQTPKATDNIESAQPAPTTTTKETINAKGIIEKGLLERAIDNIVKKAEAQKKTMSKEEKQLHDECGDAEISDQVKPTEATAKGIEKETIISPKTIMATPIPETKIVAKKVEEKKEELKKEELKKEKASTKKSTIKKGKKGF